MRREIDMIEFSGIEFRRVDNRVMSLKLVQLGLSDAAMFGPSGEVLQPSEILRKKPILVERGSFRPVTNTTLDMLDRALEQFVAGARICVISSHDARLEHLADEILDFNRFLPLEGHLEALV